MYSALYINSVYWKCGTTLFDTGGAQKKKRKSVNRYTSLVVKDIGSGYIQLENDDKSLHSLKRF